MQYTVIASLATLSKLVLAPTNRTPSDTSAAIASSSPENAPPAGDIALD